MNYESFAFEKKTFILAGFDRKIVQLVESGIADNVIAEYERSFGARKPVRVDGPVVLTLEHLGVGFMVWLFSSSSQSPFS